MPLSLTSSGKNKSSLRKVVEIDMRTEPKNSTQEEIRVKPTYLIHVCDSWVLKDGPQLLPLQLLVSSLSQAACLQLPSILLQCVLNAPKQSSLLTVYTHCDTVI